MSTCHQFEPSDGQGLATLQRHTPLGVAWDAYRIAGARAYRLWSSIGTLFDDATSALCRVVTELSPYSTTELISEWEDSVGLPDSCLPRSSTIEGRRSWVVWRLSKRRWTTAQDWHDLAALFGLTISITPGWHVQRPQLFEYRFPAGFDLFPKLGRFRVYVDILGHDFSGFEYGSQGVSEPAGFPIPFGGSSAEIDQFKCIIERVRPANVVVIWNEFPSTDDRSCDRRSFDERYFAQPFC